MTWCSTSCLTWVHHILEVSQQLGHRPEPAAGEAEGGEANGEEAEGGETYIWTFGMGMDMQHGHRHAAQTWTSHLG
jgi:hypothetical protein